jgi:hypothetical protein
VLKRFIETKVQPGTPDAVIAQTGTGKKDKFVLHRSWKIGQFPSNFSIALPGIVISFGIKFLLGDTDVGTVLNQEGQW